MNLIPVRWGAWIRTATLLFTLFWIVLFALGIPARFNELTVVCAGSECPLLALGGAEAAALSDLSFSLEAYARYHIILEIILVLVAVIPMGFIFWRMSHTWIGILAILALLSIGTNIANVLLALFNHTPAYGVWLAALSRAMLVFIPLFFFLFPKGRFVLRWNLPVVLFGSLWQILLGDKTLKLFTDNAVLLDVAYFISIGMTLAVTMAAIYSQLYRYKHLSSPEERQQVKYVILGFTSLWLSVLLWITTIELFPQPEGMPRLLMQTLGVIPVFTLQYIMPAAVSKSILRHRLWDIDILIRRTLVYATLTSLLLLVYLGSVVLLQYAINGLTGQESPLAVVISTLAIAALFTPLRLRVQAFIDRRFYRRRYDAHLAIDAFAATFRSLDDVESLSERLLQVVSETVQPEHVSLWMINQDKR